MAASLDVVVWRFALIHAQPTLGAGSSTFRGGSSTVGRVVAGCPPVGCGLSTGRAQCDIEQVFGLVGCGRPPRDPARRSWQTVWPVRAAVGTVRRRLVAARGVAERRPILRFATRTCQRSVDERCAGSSGPTVDNRPIRPALDMQPDDDQRFGSVVVGRLRKRGGRSTSQARTSRVDDLAVERGHLDQLSLETPPHGRARTRCPGRPRRAVAGRRPGSTAERPALEAARARGPDVPRRAAGAGCSGPRSRSRSSASAASSTSWPGIPVGAPCSSSSSRPTSSTSTSWSVSSTGSGGWRRRSWREFGWDPAATVSVWVIVADGSDQSDADRGRTTRCCGRRSRSTGGRCGAWLRDPAERSRRSRYGTTTTGRTLWPMPCRSGGSRRPRPRQPSCVDHALEPSGRGSLIDRFQGRRSGHGALVMSVVADAWPCGHVRAGRPRPQRARRGRGPYPGPGAASTRARTSLNRAVARPIDVSAAP